jgi:lipid-A-disaccharide synthase
MTNPTVMFVAGDPSGDQNTAPIIQQIYKEIPECKCFGIGGPMMQAEGFDPMLPFGEFNRMGYLEVLLHLPFFFKAKKLLINEMKARKPGALVCVDYYGFNLQMMKAAYSLDIPVIWYIIPKIWARKNKKRLTNLVRYTSHIATIFPFEADIFLPYKKEVSFVGNPLVEFIDSHNYTIPNIGLDGLRKKESICLALVPGSRIHEIQNCLPIMIEAAKQLKQDYPHLSVKVSRCGHIPDSMYKTIAGDLTIEVSEGPLEELFAGSDLAIVTSGTATLQAALMGIPMVIVLPLLSLK